MMTVSSWTTSAREERRRYPENADNMNEDLQAVSFRASIVMDDGVDRPYDDTRELHEEWRMYVPLAATWILIAGN